MSLDSKIAKIVEANDAQFYDTEMATEGDNSIFRVFITKDGGVSLELCALISNELSPFLDVNPPMGDKYFLEVSSPGLERKLTKPTHFQNAIGEKIKFKVIGVDKFKGTIKSADDKSVTVSIEDEDVVYPYSDLGTVKTYIDWN